MKPLRVLLTTKGLAERNGGTLYVRDLALGLFRAGHTPVVFAEELGEVGDELARSTIAVVDDIGPVAVAPDVIHGSLIRPTMAALLHFPRTPGLFVCHGWGVDTGRIPHFPRLRRYVAVDETVHERLVSREGVRADQARVIHNAVDLDRFLPRSPLPPRPLRALVFSNYAEEHNQLAAIRAACARVNLPLDVAGGASGQPCAKPEGLLGRYDLVFAKGRCALEALAVGAAVVLCDFMGAGPMVTSKELDRLRRCNFGRRILQQPWDADWLVEQVNRYDAEDARRVQERIRATAGLPQAVEAHVSLCREVMDEHCRSQAATAEDELRATAWYFQQREQRQVVGKKLGDLKAQNAQLTRERDELSRLLAIQRRRQTRRPLLAAMAMRLARLSRRMR